MRWNAKFGCLLAALWLALAMVGASPQLHHTLHEDANSPEHSCVIEHINQGSVLFTPAIPLVAPSATVIFRTLSFDSLILPSRDYRVALSRGPPAFPTFRTVAG